eukprot:29534-Rhodomonas_salina.3
MSSTIQLVSRPDVGTRMCLARVEMRTGPHDEYAEDLDEEEKSIDRQSPVGKSANDRGRGRRGDTRSMLFVAEMSPKPTCTDRVRAA